jgi:hypothetical protein
MKNEINFSGTVSIQFHCGKSWDETPYVLHEFNCRAEAIAAAYAISKQLECNTVRLVEIPSGILPMQINLKYICNLSGTYIQSKP